MTTGVERSGTTPSIRDSRFPRGMCAAPGMCPSSHSSCSRTSIQAAPASSCASRASTSTVRSLTNLRSSL